MPTTVLEQEGGEQRQARMARCDKVEGEREGSEQALAVLIVVTLFGWGSRVLPLSRMENAIDGESRVRGGMPWFLAP